jgi:hypothetical protein
MYKALVLELLLDRPQLSEPLRQKRMLLATVEIYAQTLRKKHQAWREVLSQARQASDPQQIASEALELAVEDLSICLVPEYSPPETEALSLDDAMAFIQRHSQPA